MDPDTSIGRRKLLVGAGAGLGALAVASIPSFASADPQENGKGKLTGSWFVTVSLASTPNFAGSVVLSFASGGVFSDLTLNPPGILSPSLGTWEMTGDHSFRYASWSTVTVGPNQVVAALGETQGTFSGNHIQGTFTSEFFDLSALPTSPPPPPTQPGGSFSGYRITA
jgi:hypothetical protein